MMEILIVCAAIAAISLVVAALVALCKEYILPFFIEGWNKGREKRRQQGGE